jgi:hypothetical protein
MRFVPLQECVRCRVTGDPVPETLLGIKSQGSISLNVYQQQIQYHTATWLRQFIHLVPPIFAAGKEGAEIFFTQVPGAPQSQLRLVGNAHVCFYLHV